MSKQDKYICRVIWGNIRKVQYIQNMSLSQLAAILCVSERSVYNYDAEPEKLTLNRVQLFMEATGVSMEYLMM